jgi:adenosylcobinamide-phosphate synthase
MAIPGCVGGERRSKAVGRSAPDLQILQAPGNDGGRMNDFQFLSAGMLAGLFLDVAIGWPDALFRRIGHPVSWIGRLVATLDTHWNLTGHSPQARKVLGFATVFVVVPASFLVGFLLQWALPRSLAGALVLGCFTWPFLAVRSLHAHVRNVAVPLETGNLPGARTAVAMLVGRDPANLDEGGISRAAIESLAENSSDGIIAPVFWGLIGGLPAVMAYKAINTLDSMIGHRTERFEMFGFAAAKIDDVANLVPARISGILISVASGRPGEALRCMWRDARRHRSPNAGWPEAAMAGALGIRLSGPRVYGNRMSMEPWLNEGRPDPTAADLSRALKVYRTTMAVTCGIVAVGLLF